MRDIVFYPKPNSLLKIRPLLMNLGCRIKRLVKQGFEILNLIRHFDWNKYRHFGGRTDRGSISLEAALIISILMALLIIIVLTLWAAQTIFICQSCQYKTANEAAMAFIMANTAGGLTNIPDNLKSEFDVLPVEINQGLLTVGETILSAPYLGGRFNYWFNQNQKRTSIYRRLLKNKKVLVEPVNDNWLWMVIYADIDLGIGKIPVQNKVPIYLWRGELDPDADVTNNQSEGIEDNFWSWHNFKRGKFLRDENGGNLPRNYPVLANFTNGHGLVIKSIDLTAKTYQNPEQISKQVNSWLTQLKNFDGTSNPYGSSQIHIKPGDITSRSLLVIIPENSPDAARSSLEAMQIRAGALGINLIIKEQAVSYRFSKIKLSP